MNKKKAWFVVYGNKDEKDKIIKILWSKGCKYQIHDIDMEYLEVDTEGSEVGTIWFSFEDDNVLNEISEQLNTLRLF